MTSPNPRRSTRLYRDPVDKKIGGVASGVARYFDVDTTLMRAIWAASILVGGFGFFLYLILWFILDEDPALLAELNDPTVVESAEESEASNPSGSSQFAPQTAGESDESEAEDSNASG